MSFLQDTHFIPENQCIFRCIGNKSLEPIVEREPRGFADCERSRFVELVVILDDSKDLLE